MPEEINKDIFPADFMWGGSTAAHQVEGNNHNQWSVWELAHAEKLASNAKKRFGSLSIWKDIEDKATKPENYISGKGIDHYNRYKEDFKLAKDLNLNSFRFTVEWSRLEPKQGQWDEEAFEHYRQYIQELRKKGMEPVLNIFHWTMPVWFANKGGFEKKKNLEYFDHFVHKVAQELLPHVRYVITINEPNVYASFSYLTGEWPPQKKNPLLFIKVYWNLAQAHRRAYYLLKHHKPSLQIGIAAQLANIHDMGWYMEPEGIYPLLVRLWARYKKPIIITENGVADMHDQYRRWWLEETIVAMERALSEGIDLKGYFHWSLLDNFEWSTGWWPKFGLIAVNPQNMKRTVRPSAKWFAHQISKINK
jgi:beta-glucosidase